MSEFDVDPDIFGQIGEGSGFFTHLGQMPFINKPAADGGWWPYKGIPPESDVDCNDVFPVVLPGLPAWPDGIPQEFPLAEPKDNWVAMIWSFVFAMAEVGNLQDEEDGWRFLASFLEVALIPYGTANHWEELEQSSSLPLADVDLLLSRWAAVQLVAELANWYPWSLLDFGESGLNTLLRKAVWPEDVEGFGPMFRNDSALVFTDTGSGYEIPRVFRNPLKPWLYAKFRLLSSGFPPCSPVECARLAVGLVVDWFHGPVNRYSACAPFFYANICKGTWTNPLDSYTLADPPLPMKYCKKTGQQAWMHPCHDSAWLNYDWFRSALWKAGIHYDSFEFLQAYKEGGCHMSSRFFVTCLSAANIPSMYGYNPFPSFNRSNPLEARLGVHSTIFLPWGTPDGLALGHGDDLWGPGTTLFGIEKLLVPANMALAPAKILCALEDESGVKFGKYDTYYDVATQDSQLLHSFMQCIQTGLHSTYAIAARYFLAMAESTDDPAYSQALVDACVFKKEAFGGNVFGALKWWTTRMANPAHKSFLPPSDEYVSHPPADIYPHLDPQAPNVWREPQFVVARQELRLWVENQIPLLASLPFES